MHTGAGDVPFFGVLPCVYYLHSNSLVDHGAVVDASNFDVASMAYVALVHRGVA